LIVRAIRAQGRAMVGGFMKPRVNEIGDPFSINGSNTDGNFRLGGISLAKRN
jgi:hypothetical protein